MKLRNVPLLRLYLYGLRSILYIASVISDKPCSNWSALGSFKYIGFRSFRSSGVLQSSTKIGMTVKFSSMAFVSAVFISVVHQSDELYWRSRNTRHASPCLKPSPILPATEFPALISHLSNHTLTFCCPNQ